MDENERKVRKEIKKRKKDETENKISKNVR